VVIQRAP
jgi:hypothetical protein